MSDFDEDVAVPGTIMRRRESPSEVHSLRFTVLRGPEQGQSVTVASRSVTVGRAPTAEVRLSDPLVSAFHVELAVEPNGLRLTDLNSTNGTFHAGVRLERALIPWGATIEVGDTSLRVESGAPFAPARTEVETFGAMLAESAPMRELFALLTRLSETSLSILIQGPTGAGKELVARGVHAASAFASGPFIVLDCTAIPTGLAESVLFGHERGAFTGANEARAGVFEAAAGGTIFLDEIGELSAELQPKLLRVLERREIVRVGSTRTRPLNVRIVAATWRDVRTLINRGRFREDLFYRLAQARVTIPSLSERTEDIPLLVSHFLKSVPAGERRAGEISADALLDLCGRDYPGNVRELRNVVERVASIAAGNVITSADLAFERVLSREVGRRAPASRTSKAPPSASATGANGAAAEALVSFKAAKQTAIDEFEREYLSRMVERTDGNITRAAQLAGVERHHLRELLKKHGLWSPDEA